MSDSSPFSSGMSGSDTLSSAGLDSNSFGGSSDSFYSPSLSARNSTAMIARNKTKSEPKMSVEPKKPAEPVVTRSDKMSNVTNNIGSEIAKISEGLKETMEAFKKSADKRLNN